MNTQLRSGIIAVTVVTSLFGIRSVVNANQLQNAANTFTELSCEYKAEGYSDKQSVLHAAEELGKDFFQQKVRSENKGVFKDALAKGLAKCNISV